MAQSKKHTVETFLAEVGRSQFMARVNCSTQSVTRAVRENTFPAHWFFDVRDWLQGTKIEIPEHLFRKSHGLAAKQNVNAEPSRQPPTPQGKENLTSEAGA